MAPAGYAATVSPWVDEQGADVKISTIIHNQGLTPVILRKHSTVGSVGLLEAATPGPKLFETEASPAPAGPTTESVIAQVAPQALPHTLPPSDWRCGPSGKPCATTIKAALSSDLERLKEFNT